MLSEVLREGFAQAHRRPGLIVIDMIWKLIWLALTLAGVAIAVYVTASQTVWPPPNLGQVADQFIGTLGIVAAVSLFLWMLLEAIFRRRLVATTTLILLASNTAKIAIFSGAVISLASFYSQSHEVAIPGLIGFTALGFLIVVIDTLIRSDALDLLGTNLFEIVGLIGTLLLFEGLIGSSVGVGLIAGFLNVSNLRDALIMCGVTGLVLLVFNFLHSYLLVVRFSAVDIMRRNVVEV